MLIDIERAIEARRHSIFSLYEVEKEKQLKKIDELFEEINKLGEQFDNLQAFENAFNSSELNDRYIKLFSELSQTCKSKISGEYEKVDMDIKGAVKDTIKTELEMQYYDATMPTRHKVYEESMEKMRSTPILGDLIQMGQTASVLKRFIKKKK